MKYLEPNYDMFTDKYDHQKATYKYHEKPEFLKEAASNQNTKSPPAKSSMKKGNEPTPKVSFM